MVNSEIDITTACEPNKQQTMPTQDTSISKPERAQQCGLPANITQSPRDDFHAQLLLIPHYTDRQQQVLTHKTKAQLLLGLLTVLPGNM